MNNGRIPEWPKGADCKSVAFRFGGPNPPAPTKPVRFSYGFIFIYNLPLASLDRQGVLSKISFQDISGSRQKSLCSPARLYASLAPISLKSEKCQNIRFIIS